MIKVHFSAALGEEPKVEVARVYERGGRLIDFWVAFSEVVIIVRGSTHEVWSRSR